MVKLTINGTEIEVEPGSTVFQACQLAGVEIPHFCYHPKLSIAGNCRMCLVEIEKSPKPVASCAMPACEGMNVHTHTPTVEKARQGVLEFLLINHPLDCPICDQGGECDLQDLTLNYGKAQSRYELNKRAVREKYMGPLIKTVMTRCIHCTRCVRFAQEIAGVPEVGTLGRGEHMEIVTYLEGAATSELSGNMIDICPVGALTSKPYAFHGRSWELNKTYSIDVMDAVGSHIRIDTRGQDIMRVLPHAYEEINEEWISDKTRFSYDGLKIQRLDTPYIKIDGSLTPCAWPQAFDQIRQKIYAVSGNQIAALAGDLVDVESTYLLKELLNSFNCTQFDCRPLGLDTPYEHPAHYVMNINIAQLEEADAILLLGTNPRLEAALVNARIRKRYLMSKVAIGLIGEPVDLTYPYHHLGSDVGALLALIENQHAFSKSLKEASHPVVIVGENFYRYKNASDAISLLLSTFNFIQPEWCGYGILHNAAGRVGAMDVGFLPQNNDLNALKILQECKAGNIQVLFLHGRDDCDRDQIGDTTFVIYIGHHGDKGAQAADVILPGAAYSEKTALYVNTEGRCQKAYQAVTPPGHAREDWRIIRALSEVLEHSLPYNSQEEIWKALAQHAETFQHIGHCQKRGWKGFKRTQVKNFQPFLFSNVFSNYYFTNIISRHSSIMAASYKEIHSTMMEKNHV